MLMAKPLSHKFSLEDFTLDDEAWETAQNALRFDSVPRRTPMRHPAFKMSDEARAIQHTSKGKARHQTIAQFYRSLGVKSGLEAIQALIKRNKEQGK